MRKHFYKHLILILSTLLSSSLYAFTIAYKKIEADKIYQLDPNIGIKFPFKTALIDPGSYISFVKDSIFPLSLLSIEVLGSPEADKGLSKIKRPKSKSFKDPLFSEVLSPYLNLLNTVKKKHPNYSLGHAAPSGDFPYSPKKTFLSSNVALQWQENFNGGIWSTLEGCVRIWQSKLHDNESMTVLTGFNYRKGPQALEKDLIPLSLYKIIYFQLADGRQRTVSFLMTNKAHKEKSSYLLGKFLSNIQTIEKSAEVKFFGRLKANEAPHIYDLLQNGCQNHP